MRRLKPMRPLLMPSDALSCTRPDQAADLCNDVRAWKSVALSWAAASED
jgi:hypothetical protein